jgi:hypothetical protein
MALKAMLSTLDGLDEALKPLYKKTDDGKYALEVEGLTDNRSKLEEFRATNRALLEKVEELQKQLGGFRGLDPVKYKELQDKMATLEEKRLLEDGKIDEVISARNGCAASSRNSSKPTSRVLSFDKAPINSTFPCHASTLPSSRVWGPY